MVMVGGWKVSAIASRYLVVKGAPILRTTGLRLAARALWLFTDEPLPYTSNVSVLSSPHHICMYMVLIHVDLHSGSPLRKESNTWR